MKNCSDKDNAYPFEDLLTELYNCRQDRHRLECLGRYIVKNKYDYCLVHLTTLMACCNGYLLALNE